MSGEERIRAFVAVDLPDPARRAAVAVADALRARPHGDAVRWVRPEALHVTLRFLGNVDASTVPGLAERVRAEVAGCAPFQLLLGGVHTFPQRRQPRVVALGVAPEAPLAALAAAVERGVVAAGLDPEDRPFRPHLTLGRLRDRRCPDTSGLDPEPAPFQVHEAVLFRSTLSPRGATYTPLEPLALGGAEVHPRHTDHSEGERT